MLQLSHLKKSYGKKEVLKDVDFIFNKGQLYPILGGVGSGRTTLFECIGEDLSLDEGVITTKEKSTLFLAAKQSVLPMYVTGYQYIKFLCQLNKGSEKAFVYLDRVHIKEEVRDNLICDYGFEDKKRLQLAAFLIQKPYVMMFDEPFDYCDEQYIADFIEVLNSMKEEHIILISTGLLSIAEKISEDTVVLNNGELSLVTKDTMQIPEIKKAILAISGEADNGII